MNYSKSQILILLVSQAKHENLWAMNACVRGSVDDTAVANGCGTLLRLIGAARLPSLRIGLANEQSKRAMPP
jgi:hypothetical protein